MSKRFILLLVIIAFFAGAIFMFKGDVESWMQQAKSNHIWMLPMVVIAAGVDSINPCAFSVLLLTIAFLMSLGRKRSSILGIGSVYIFSIFLVYIGIGIALSQAMRLLNIPHLISRIGGGILVAVGAINLANEFYPAFPVKLKIPEMSKGTIARLMEKASYPAVFVLGTLVAFFEFPCTGGPYVMILGLLSAKATVAEGAAYLVLYNFIFVLPLIIILLMASDSGLYEKVQGWKKGNTRGMRYWGGIAAVILGSVIFLL